MHLGLATSKTFMVTILMSVSSVGEARQGSHFNVDTQGVALIRGRRLFETY